MPNLRRIVQKIFPLESPNKQSYRVLESRLRHDLACFTQILQFANCLCIPICCFENMVHTRLNEKVESPNPHINFITALPGPSHDDALSLLRALAAQLKPVMKASLDNTHYR